MTVLTVDGLLLENRISKEGDFHIKKVSKTSDILGLNIVLILQVDKEDTPDFVNDVIYRVHARFP